MLTVFCDFYSSLWMNLVIVDLPERSRPYKTMNFPCYMCLLMWYKVREINLLVLYVMGGIMCIGCVVFMYFYMIVFDWGFLFLLN